MVVKDSDRKKLIVFKIKRKNLYLVVFFVILFLLSSSAFYYNKKQDEKNSAYKISSEIKKDDKYWRQFGELVFDKIKKSINLNSQLTGETAKEFQNDVNVALGYFNKAKELNPDSYDNWLALAKFQDFLIPYVSGAQSDAVASYLHILKFFPNNNDVVRQAVRVLIIASDKASLLGSVGDANNSLLIAEQLSKNLSQSDPVNLYGQYYRALIARRQKNFNFATSTLEQIKPFLNKEPDLYFELGQAYLETNQLGKSKVNFEAAAAMSDIYKKNSEMFLRLIEEKSK